MRHVPFWAIRLWPAAGLVATAVTSSTAGAVLMFGFFTLVVLWPAVLLVERLFGERAAVAAAGTCTALLIAQTLLPTPQLTREPVWLTRPFDAEGQIARHSILLPTQVPSWGRLWMRSPEPEASLYVAVNLAEGVEEPGIQVRLGGELLGELTRATRLKDGSPWYHLPVTRAELERARPLEVTLAPRPGDLLPGAVGLRGGFSYRPTLPPQPSAFFDGGRWLTEPQALLPDYGIQGAGPARYYVELRVIDVRTRRVLATYY